MMLTTIPPTTKAQGVFSHKGAVPEDLQLFCLWWIKSSKRLLCPVRPTCEKGLYTILN